MKLSFQDNIKWNRAIHQAIVDACGVYEDGLKARRKHYTGFKQFVPDVVKRTCMISGMVEQFIVEELEKEGYKLKPYQANTKGYDFEIFMYKKWHKIELKLCGNMTDLSAFTGNSASTKDQADGFLLIRYQHGETGFAPSNICIWLTASLKDMPRSAAQLRQCCKKANDAANTSFSTIKIHADDKANGCLHVICGDVAVANIWCQTVMVPFNKAVASQKSTILRRKAA